MASDPFPLKFSLVSALQQHDFFSFHLPRLARSVLDCGCLSPSFSFVDGPLSVDRLTPVVEFFLISLAVFCFFKGP